MIKVKDILREKGSNAWSITSKATTYQALEMMADKDVGALLVVDDGNLVGIFSERDYARKVVLEGKSSRDTLVEDLMTREVYSVTPSDTIDDCMGVMSSAHCRHLPVIENGQLAGVVSIGDIVNAVIEDQKVKIGHLEHYITGRR